MAKTGILCQIGIFCFQRDEITDGTIKGGVVSCAISKRTRATTSTCAGEIRSLFYGIDMAMAMEGLLEELIFGNTGVGIPTYVHSGSSDALYQAGSANTVGSENY